MDFSLKNFQLTCVTIFLLGMGQSVNSKVSLSLELKVKEQISLIMILLRKYLLNHTVSIQKAIF